MEKLKEMKSELREMVKNLKLSEIPKVLNGVNDVRRYGVSFDGEYTCNSEEGVEVVGKDGLVLTLKTDDYNSDYELLFESYVDEEGVMDIEDWNGEFTFTITKHTSVYLLCYLLNFN